MSSSGSGVQPIALHTCLCPRYASQDLSALLLESLPEGREDALIPDDLRSVEEEPHVGDEAGILAGLSALGNEVPEVNLLLEMPRHRQGEHLAPVAGQEAPLADHRHAAAGPRLHLPGQDGQVEALRSDRVHEPHARDGLGGGAGEAGGLRDLSLVDQDLLLEPGESLLVALARGHELAEELGLGGLAHLRPLRVEGGQSAEAPDGEPAELAEALGGLGRPDVEDGGIGVQLGVGHPECLHSGREAVHVGVRHDDGPGGGKLSGLHQE